MRSKLRKKILTVTEATFLPYQHKTDRRPSRAEGRNADK
jgi:hypothetical protein